MPGCWPQASQDPVIMRLPFRRNNSLDRDQPWNSHAEDRTGNYPGQHLTEREQIGGQRHLAGLSEDDRRAIGHHPTDELRMARNALDVGHAAWNFLDKHFPAHGYPDETDWQQGDQHPMMKQGTRTMSMTNKTPVRRMVGEERRSVISHGSLFQDLPKVCHIFQ